MKINFVIPGLGISGGVRVVFEYANHLSKRGHDVTVLYPLVPPRRGERWLAFRPRVTQVLKTVQRCVETGVDWMDVEAPLQRIPALSERLLNRLDYFVPDADITIATAWETAYPVSALDESKGKKAYFVQNYEIWPLWNDPVCWTEAAQHDLDPSVGMVDVKPDDAKLARYKRLVDESYRLPLAIIVTSEWERQVIDRINGPIAGSTFLGVDFDRFFPTTDSSSNLTLLALYRNSAHKGDNQAIGSFTELNERHDDVDFVMFGKSKSVDLPSFIDYHPDPDHHQLRELYSRADLLVYPSWVEGYGMPPMEAMACKTGLVSTDVGAVREYTPPEGVRFVPIQDTDAIVTEVETLLEDPKKIDEMKNACFEHIQQYTWDRAAARFEEVLHGIVGR